MLLDHAGGNARLCGTGEQFGLAGVEHAAFGQEADIRVSMAVHVAIASPRPRFIDWQWHTKDGHIWVAEVSYTLDSALTRLRLTGVRSWRVDQHGKPVGVSEFMPGPAEVLLYDAPQPVWPCTAQQWAAIMEPPRITAVPPGNGSGPSWALKGGWAPPNPLATRCGVGSLTYYTMSGHC